MYDAYIVKKAPSTPLPGEIKVYDGEVDPATVGSICYLAVVTRPDIAKAASKLSESFGTGPRGGCWPLPSLFVCNQTPRNRIFSIGIRWGASGGPSKCFPTNQVFEATTDASYANYPDRKSGEGYTFRLFGGLIDWASRKETTVTTSTTEAELPSLFHASKELIWWDNLFSKVRFDTGHNLTISNDNLHTIRLLNSEIPRMETRLRHIDISQCWLRQEFQRGRTNVDYIPTGAQIR